MPSQYTHLMNYCKDHIRRDKNKNFTKNVQCGELIFWMAEASNAVRYEELDELKNEILENYTDNRSAGNTIIQEACFNNIISLIEFEMSHK